MHLLGSDLNLDGLALWADHRGVQRLVHVVLRHRDEVLEASRDRTPARVDDAQRGVTVPHAVDQDAHPDEVVDVVEVASPHHHLLVDRVVVLGPPGHHCAQPRRPKVGVDLLDDLVEVLVASGGALADQVNDLLVHLGLQGGERQVLELPLDRVHAQAVGQRGVDLEGLGCLLALFRGRQPPQGSHVVQTVGQFDHQHADVPRHGNHHLAHSLGGRGLAVGDAVQLGDAVDQPADLVAEVRRQGVEGVLGVLDGVVEQRRRQGRSCHAQFGQDRRDRQRVRDVGLPGAAQLVLVQQPGGLVGALQQAQIGLGVELLDGPEQGLEFGVAAAGPHRDPRQPVSQFGDLLRGRLNRRHRVESRGRAG